LFLSSTTMSISVALSTRQLIRSQYIRTIFRQIPLRSFNGINSVPVINCESLLTHHFYHRKFSTYVEAPKIVNETEHLLNEGIKAEKVRLIHGDVQEIMSRAKALSIAKKEGLDLVVVAPQAEPVVCKIFDYRKELYKKKVQMRETKKEKKAVTLGEMKEIKMKSVIADHDLKIKCKKIAEALKKNHPVRIMVTSNLKTLKATPTVLADITKLVENSLIEHDVPFTIQPTELRSASAMQMMILPVRAK
jgi:translation initiation factor IF-3